MRIICFLFLTVPLFSYCKSRTPSSSVEAVDPKAALTLDDFSHEPGTGVFPELSSRIGCEQAQRWVITPSMPFSKLIPALKSHKVPYDLLNEKLFSASIPCSTSQKASNTDGIKKIHDLVVEKGFGLTVVMVGGLGSHLTKEGALAYSRAAWDKALPKETFRSARIECLPNSYASDDICAPVVQRGIEDLIASEGAKPHLYLVWGYSKGGTVSSQVLSKSLQIRNKLLALVTVGSPFGGGVPMHAVVPLIDKLTESFDKMTLRDQLIFKGLMLTGSGYSGSSEQLKSVAGFTELFTPQQFPIVKAGLNTVLPSHRAKFLRNVMPTWDYSRTEAHPFTGKLETPIFHVSASANIAKFKVVPDFTVHDDASFSVQPESVQIMQVAEMAIVKEFARHPVSDMCVALEHSVIPEFAKPKGATTELIALLQMDHLGLGFSDSLAPGEAIVDSILATVGKKLGGRP